MSMVYSFCSDAPPVHLVELLRRQAENKPEACAFTFLWDDGNETSLSFGQLDDQARRIAATLQELACAGDRALLVFPPGLEFIPAFFGCLYAGVSAVPATYPKPRRPSPRLLAIADDCQARIALTTSQTLATLDLARVAPELLSLQWVATDEVPQETSTRWQCPQIQSDDLAFLQYTSGSTSEPKGVMVSHGNLIQNLEMIRQGFDIASVCAASDSENGVSWLPAYHDMGLIGGILESLYVGGRTVLMSPAAFLQRPLRWLRAISDYRAVISGAPNFAYELCARKIGPEERRGLDLSHWRVAFCGAEPIRAETLTQFAETFAPCGFRAEAFYPCYGLAEATLLASGGRGPARPTVLRVQRCALAANRVVKAGDSRRTETGAEFQPFSSSIRPASGEASVPLPEKDSKAVQPDPAQTQQLIGCGQPLLDQQILIVDPETRKPAAPDQVGEVWIKGPNVARGYWNRPEENAETFHALLADGGDDYLRTGDLGFVCDGNLYITGRVKDVIIIRGRNHYPQDIELTMDNAHSVLPAGAGAAFSIELNGRERLVAIHEIERQHRHVDLQEVIRSLRRAVAVEHELDLHAVVLIRPVSLPRTTSGKVQRRLCRDRYLAGELKALAQWVHGRDHANSLGNGHGNGSPAAPSGNGHRREQAGDVDGRGEKGTSEAGGKGTATTEKIENILPRIHLPARPLRRDEVDRLCEQIQTWILDWLVERAGVSSMEITTDRPFAEFGLDSLTAVELSQELEDWLNIELTPVIAWNYPTLASLSRYLAENVGARERGGVQAEGVAVEAVPESSFAASPAATEFERLLAEIETLSDDEAESALHHGTGT